MQGSAGELGLDYWGVAAILKDSKKCFVLLLVPELFLFCPVTHGNGRSNPWIREVKKKDFSAPPSSFTGK